MSHCSVLRFDSFNTLMHSFIGTNVWINRHLLVKCQNGVVSGIPYLVLWGIMVLTGFLADWMRKKNFLSTTNVRKLFNAVGEIFRIRLFVDAEILWPDRCRRYLCSVQILKIRFLYCWIISDVASLCDVIYSQFNAHHQLHLQRMMSGLEICQSETAEQTIREKAAERDILSIYFWSYSIYFKISRPAHREREFQIFGGGTFLPTFYLSSSYM